MTKETPKWLQAGSYAARLDRHVIQELFRGKNRVLRGMQVTQKAGGASLTQVDVSSGSAIVIGTTQQDQGGYLCRSTGLAPEPVVPSPTPAANRTDGVYLVVRDPNAGGPIGDDFYFLWGQRCARPFPGDSRLLIATITRHTRRAVDRQHRDHRRASAGEWSWTVGTAAPTALAPDGDLYVQVS